MKQGHKSQWLPENFNVFKTQNWVHEFRIIILSNNKFLLSLNFSVSCEMPHVYREYFYSKMYYFYVDNFLFQSKISVYSYHSVVFLLNLPLLATKGRSNRVVFCAYVFLV